MGPVGAPWSEEEERLPESSGKGFFRKMSSLSSMFSRAKISDNTPTTTAPKTPSAAAAHQASAAASALPPVAPPLSAPAGIDKEPSKESVVDVASTSSGPTEVNIQPPSAPPASILSAVQGTSPQKPHTKQFLPSTGPDKKVSTTSLRSTNTTGATTPTAAPAANTPSSRPTPTLIPAALKTPRTPTTSAPDARLAARLVAPEITVIPFNIREPSFGAAIVGQLVILEGSCYVWAAAEGSAAQGPLAAAVSTKFDGGMPTATSLLAGIGGGDARGGEVGGGGGLSVSMAQRLCKRTGRVVFVSCDLSEDSQVLVAAVEGKVVKLLKAAEEGEI